MDFVTARHKMMDNQILTNRVTDPRVSEALASTPREVFLPRQMRGFAYVDEDVAIGGGRFLIEPLVLARLLQKVGIGKTDVVLTIGDATGWASAVVSKIASTVVSLECEPEMVSRSTATLSEQGVDNVAVVHGDLAAGFPAQAPYDAIVFIGAVAEIPAAIIRQLADGGRLIAVVDDGNGIGRGVLVVRAGDSFGRNTLFDAQTPHLPGFAPKPKFVF